MPAVRSAGEVTAWPVARWRRCRSVRRPARTLPARSAASGVRRGWLRPRRGGSGRGRERASEAAGGAVTPSPGGDGTGAIPAATVMGSAGPACADDGVGGAGWARYCCPAPVGDGGVRDGGAAGGGCADCPAVAGCPKGLAGNPAGPVGAGAEGCPAGEGGAASAGSAICPG